jgi:hypothetical protein
VYRHVWQMFATSAAAWVAPRRTLCALPLRRGGGWSAPLAHPGVVEASADRNSPRAPARTLLQVADTWTKMPPVPKAQVEEHLGGFKWVAVGHRVKRAGGGRPGACEAGRLQAIMPSVTGGAPSLPLYQSPLAGTPLLVRCLSLSHQAHAFAGPPPPTPPPQGALQQGGVQGPRAGASAGGAPGVGGARGGRCNGPGRGHSQVRVGRGTGAGKGRGWCI